MAFVALIVVFAASGCVAPLSVEEVKPPRPESVVVSKAELKAATHVDRNQPMVSAGATLDSLRVVYDRVVAGDESAIPEYNYLLSRLVEHLRKTKIQPWQNSVSVPSRKTQYIVRGTQPPDLDAVKRIFVPTDTISFSGRYASNEGERAGVGAPLVAFIGADPSERKRYSDEVRFRDVTAIIRFEGNQATVSLEDPYDVDAVSLGSRRYTLAASFGAGVSYAVSKERIDKLGLARLLKPGMYDDTEYLGRFQPYDPDRIPVLLVHGLQDTPASFLPMFMRLISDPNIRKKYQFWAFSYPSGYAYPLPAADLRRELDRIKKKIPDHRDIVIIGHSMGGLISRLMVTSSEDRLWKGLFGKSPAETEIAGDSRTILEDALIFSERSEISRAVFFSAPHRGSNLASNWVGKIGSKLVRLPATMADTRDAFVNAANNDQSRRILDKVPNSIDTLSPTNPFVVGINKIPLSQRVPFHSVMGDRGKDQPKEETSDGVVAYWSSHLDGAESELLVPSDHSSHQHPQGIEEARRILYLHAGLNYTAPAASN